MGQAGSTTDQQRAPSLTQRAREQIIAQPGVFARMRASATNHYWHGRIARVYFTSMVWNLMHKRVFTAASRAVWGMMSLIIAAPHLISPQYWQALLKPYQSEIFSRGFTRASSSMAAEESMDQS
jgi:hypothetical protein